MSKARSRRWRLLIFPIAGLAVWGALSSASFFRVQALFDQPRDFRSWSNLVTDATYRIHCDGASEGSAWGVQLEGQYFVVTNFHVVEDCVDAKQFSIWNGDARGTSLELLVTDGSFWDENTYGLKDFAIFRASRPINTLEIQMEQPSLGQWVAASGYPANSYGEAFHSITTGRITSVESGGILVTDAAINGGNSGGPLVNSQGQVVGTVFASEDNASFDNMGYALGVILHCDLLIDCTNGAPTLNRPN